MPLSPPNPTSAAEKPRRWWLVAGLVVAGVLAVVVGSVLAVRSVLATGITRGPDNLFGDQHLKTAVALIELHKVRFGEYPETLGDLKYVGQWDQIALQSVGYTPNADRSAYYLEVRRGWIGRPDLRMPDEFWQGTGYSADLKTTDK